MDLSLKAPMKVGRERNPHPSPPSLPPLLPFPDSATTCLICLLSFQPSELLMGKDLSVAKSLDANTSRKEGRREDE